MHKESRFTYTISGTTVGALSVISPSSSSSATTVLPPISLSHLPVTLQSARTIIATLQGQEACIWAELIAGRLDSLFLEITHSSNNIHKV